MSSSETKRDLIIDFGLHKGEDTEYYLLEKGFRVAAIEADPALARVARRALFQRNKNWTSPYFRGSYR